MKKRSTKLIRLSLSLIIFGLMSFFTQAQDYTLYLQSGEYRMEENVKTLDKISDFPEFDFYHGFYYGIIQFKQIPDQSLKQSLHQTGIVFGDYLPKNSWIVALPENLNVSDLKMAGLRSIKGLTNIDKLHRRVTEKPVPDWVYAGNKLRLQIQPYPGLNAGDAANELSELGFESEIKEAFIYVLIEEDRIDELAALPFIQFIDFGSEPGRPESDDGRNLHRSNVIDADYDGGLQFDGTGVSAAINDDGFVGPHIDFKGRADQSDVANDFTGTHGDMTVGIVGSAGNINPIMRGMAPGAFLWIRQYSSSMPNTEDLHQNEDVMVFSTSYSNGCNAGYTSVTQLVDQEIYNNPALMQVFSAGNSNGSDCGYGAGTEWGNITGGHKMGKNVIAVANLYNTDLLAGSSSRGPASDGRIKPDLASHGQGQWSNAPDYQYAAGGGTSAAAPGVAGVFAQLEQAYRSLNNGNNAPSALLKSALMNTAYDLGNPGPDFKYGWGKINALRSYELLEKEHYYSDSISTNQMVNDTLVVPANVQQLRLMLYWADKEASTSSAFALVNNLDLKLVSPAGDTLLPLVLDFTPDPTLLDLPAAPGIDSVNNVEQIRIDLPSSGNYMVLVNGTSIPTGPQEFYVVYEFITDDIRLTYPNGGEGLVPGTDERIHWDAYGTSGSFTIDYSLDNGSNWTILSNSVPGTDRFYDYTVPYVLSKALFRVSRNGVSDESDAECSIIPIPQNLNVSAICYSDSTIRLNWDSVPGAVSYDIFLLGEKYMDSVASTSALTYEVDVPDINAENWLSVRAVGPNLEKGRRAIAVLADGSACMLNCLSDNDAGIKTILSPGDFLETCTGTSFPVEVELENIGPLLQNNFTLAYQLNNGPVVIDTLTSGLNPNSVVNFTFSEILNLPGAGSYNLKVWTMLDNDGATCNDTLELQLIYQDALNAFPVSEDFESNIFPPVNFKNINPDNDLGWELGIVIGSDGLPGQAAFVNNFNYNASGQEDALEMVSIDLSNTLAATLNFDVAYVQYSSSYSDALRVDASTDCGQTFTQIYYKAGSLLATAASSTSLWAPSSASDWRNESVDLSGFSGNQVKLRFVNITDYGNSLCIDNINIESLSQAPTALFQADVLSTCNGMVQFTDLSTNSPQSWQWDFGDNSSSAEQNPFHNYNEEGMYDVSLVVSNGLGSDTLIYQAYINVDFPDQPILDQNDTTSCNGEPLQLSGTGNADALYWYINGDFITSGDTLVTSSFNTDLLIEAVNVDLNPSQYVGPADSSIGTGGYHGSTFIGTVNFVAETGLLVISAWKDAEYDGDRTFFLWDAYNGQGNVLQEITVFVPSGPGRIELGFEIPGPGLYSIGAAGVDMYRNNSGANYPYEIPGLISLTGSSAGSPGYYYYLYDWEVQKAPCKSLPVPLNIYYSKADFNWTNTDGFYWFTDASVGANSWYWDFGDGQISTLQNPAMQYTQPGNYTVSLTVNGICIKTYDIDVNVSSITENTANSSWILIPNPAIEKIFIVFQNKTDDFEQASVFTSLGQKLKSFDLSPGVQKTELELSQLAEGMYFVALYGKNKTEIKRFVISRK